MRVDHIGIAVPSLREALDRWRPLLGEAETSPEEIPSQKVRVAFFRVGETDIEMLEPTTADSAVGRFLDSRGAGIHHLAFGVPNVDEALSAVVGRGGKVVDRVGRPGARGRRVGFAHPSAFGGVLVEFVESP